MGVRVEVPYDSFTFRLAYWQILQFPVTPSSIWKPVLVLVLAAFFFVAGDGQQNWFSLIIFTDPPFDCQQISAQTEASGRKKVRSYTWFLVSKIPVLCQPGSNYFCFRFLPCVDVDLKFFAIKFHLLGHMSWMGRLNFVERFKFALAFCLQSRSSVQLASVMRILLAPQQQGTSTSGLRTLWKALIGGGV